MKRTTAVMAVAASLLLFSAPLSAQFGVAVKAGSAGVGADVGFSLSGPLTLRAGAGYLPLERDGDLSGRTFSIETPPTLVTVGADLKLVGPLRLTGGVLFRSDDIVFSTDISGSTTIGNETYTSSGTLHGRMEDQKTAPYLGIGFGSLTGTGIGFFAEVGAAFTGEPTFRLTGSGPISEQPGFEASLREEERKIQDDHPEWLKFWPMVQVGLRIGLGGG